MVLRHDPDPSLHGYGLYDREFVRVLEGIDDIQPFFKAVVAEYGLNVEIIQYDQGKSARGKSNFNFLRNYDFAMQGITSSTKLLMRLATFIAAIIGFICLGLAVFVLINKIINWNTYDVGEASTPSASTSSAPCSCSSSECSASTS